jgi:hypothetical protein
MIEFSADHFIQWLERRWERKSTIASLLICLLVALVWKFGVWGRPLEGTCQVGRHIF